MYFFFFSSRRRHTRLQGDWSSDVCSSDLPAPTACAAAACGAREKPQNRLRQIGRASCRERVEISVVAVSLKKKKKVKRVGETLMSTETDLTTTSPPWTSHTASLVRSRTRP